jgi:hypothetical protein
MAGDYNRKRIIYQDKSTSADFAATDGDTTLVTGKTSYTLYIQRISVMIKTSAAQTITFQDSNGTAVYVAKLPSSPGVDTPWVFDFGDSGKALTSGKNLSMIMTAGNAGHVEVLAYMKPDNNIAVAST